MRLFLSFLFLFSIELCGAQPSVPALTSPVMDQAGLLSPREKEDLSALAYEIHTHKGPQITVLTVPDLQGYPIEEFSIRVAEKWQLGTKKEGNGLLIIISKADRKVRIEVGEGIEGEVTDYESNVYVNQVLVPAFKAGQFHGGLRTVMEDVARKFNIKFGESRSRIVRRAPPRSSSGLEKLFPFLIIVMVLGQILFARKALARGMFSGLGVAGAGFFMMPGLGVGLILLFIFGLIFGLIGANNLLYALASSGGGRRGGGFGGFGGGGGGGWSGGGGGFSGGGSSGSW